MRRRLSISQWLVLLWVRRYFRTKIDVLRNGRLNDSRSVHRDRPHSLIQLANDGTRIKCLYSKAEQTGLLYVQVCIRVIVPNAIPWPYNDGTEQNAAMEIRSAYFAISLLQIRLIPRGITRLNEGVINGDKNIEIRRVNYWWARISTIFGLPFVVMRILMGFSLNVNYHESPCSFN